MGVQGEIISEEKISNILQKSWAPTSEKWAGTMPCHVHVPSSAKDLLDF